MNELHKIDELFKKGLSDYQSELPSLKTKRKIFGKIIYYKYLKMIFFVFTGIFITTTSILAYHYLFSNKIIINKEKKHAVSQYLSGKKDKNLWKGNKHINNTLTAKKQIDKPYKKVINFAEIKPIEKNKIFYTDKNALKATNNLIRETFNEKENNNFNIDSPEIQKVTLTTNNIIEETKPTLNEKTDFLIKAEEKKQADNNVNLLKKSDNVVNIITENKENNSNKTEDLIKRAYSKPFINNFEAVIGADFSYIDKKLKASDEFDELSNIRNKGEKPVCSVSPYLGIRYNFKNYFFQLGIQYQNYGEKTDISKYDIKQVINSHMLHYDTLYYVKDSLNPPGEWHLDTIWYTEYDTSVVTKKYGYSRVNSYKYFEIPFMIGRRIDFQQFSLELLTGISMGVCIKADGLLLSSDLKTPLIISSDNSPYLNRIILNYHLNIAIRYKLSERWSLFLSPGFKYNIGSLINNDLYPVEQHYLLYNIGSGLIYKF